MGEYLKLLRKNRQYRFLWLGAVASLLGDWFNLIASAELITQLSSTGTAISFLFLARFVPSFIFSPFAGVLVDRFDRRKLMVGADLLRVVIVLSFLLIREPQHIWLLYVLTILQFMLSSIFVPAKTSVIATIVAEEDLVTANALDSVTWSTMLALGSLLGGLVAGYFGRDTAFILDGLTFLASAYFISRLAPAKPTKVVLKKGEGRLSEMLGGIRYLWGVPFLFAVAIVKAAGSLSWGAINVLEIQYASELFPIGESGSATLGIMYAATGLGTGLGPLVLRKWVGDTVWRMCLGILISFVCVAVGIYGLGLASTFLLLLVATFIRGAGSGALWVFSTVILQSAVSDNVRGRVFAFEYTLITLAQSLSVSGAGWGQDQLGIPLREVTLYAGVVGSAMLLWWTIVLIRRKLEIRQYELA